MQKESGPMGRFFFVRLTEEPNQSNIKLLSNNLSRSLFSCLLNRTAKATATIRSIFFILKVFFKLKNDVMSSPFCEKRCKINTFFAYVQIFL